MGIHRLVLLIAALALALIPALSGVRAQDVQVQAQPVIVGPVMSAGEAGKAAYAAPPTGSQGPGPRREIRVGGPGGQPGAPESSPGPSAQPGMPGQGEKKPGEGEKKPGESDKKPGEGAGTPAVPAVQRPTTPPKPGDPEELKLQPDAEGRIRFNFTNQKWLDVLEWFAGISKMSLDWQELPGDYLNLVTTESYSLEESRDLINRHLLARGYTLLRRGEVMSVVKLDKLNPAMVPWIDPGELDDRDNHEFVKTTFALDWLLADAAAEELKHLVSQHGKLNALKTTNRLEAIDVVVNLREIRRLLAEEQSDTGEGRLVVPFVLEHTRAAEVRQLLMQLLGIEDKPKGGIPGMPQPGQPGHPQPQPQPQRGGEQPPGMQPKKEAEVNIVADDRTNTIYVHAPPDKIAVVRQAIEAIDVPKGESELLGQSVTRMKIYRLESLDPEPVIKTLKDLGGLSVDARLEIDKENRAIVAYASLADHVVIASIVEKLDGGARHSEVIQLTDLRAESVARTVNYMMGGGPEEGETEKEGSDEENRFGPFFFPGSSSSQRKRSQKHEDRFRVDADVKNNRLLLWCNDFELAKVEELLEKLRATGQAAHGDHSVQVHRLTSLAPEPLIKTLVDMETLSFGAKLEADEQSKAIIAYASEADHAKIRDLIATLDGSGREFHVMPLRRLEADYVAGTIAFMMAGKEDDQSSGSRGYSYYYDYYSYGRRSSRDQRKKDDEFRVDADIEFNRLLLWANQIEMEEVKNLLVKLGEIPPEGGDPKTLRVLDLPPGPERDRLLQQLREAWPSLSPNPLLLPSEQSPSEAESESKEQDKSSGKTTAAELPDAAVLAQGTTPSPLIARVNQVSRQLETQQPAWKKAEGLPDAPPGPSPPALPSDEISAGSNASASASPAGVEADSQGPPAVSVSTSADGRLILSSQDTLALDRLEMLIAELAPSRRDYNVIQLKYAEAYWVALTLEDFFDEGKKKDEDDNYWRGWYGYAPSSSSSDDAVRRLSKRRPLKFISDDTTNTILVQGATPDQMRTVQDLVELYDRPAMTDSDSARKTELFQIRFAKVATVAEAIKDVYRDLLSENDKALQSAKKKDEDRPESRYTYIYGMESNQEEDPQRKPRFKGYLSLGVDEDSNTLVVSAPEFLFRDISRLIEQFDEAARPTSDTVYVHRLPSGVDRVDLRERLAKILQSSTARIGEGKAQQAAEKAGEAAADGTRAAAARKD